MNKYSILNIILDKETKVIIVRMRGVNALDATAMNSLDSLYKRCSKKDIKIIFSHVNAQPLSIMKKSGFYKKVGKENFCPHINNALILANNMLKK